MNEHSLLSEGFTLLLLGMGTVFVFLTILVIVTSIMSYVIQTWFPAPVTAVSPSKGKSASNLNTDEGQLIAVITAAIHQHRQSKSEKQKQ